MVFLIPAQAAARTKTDKLKLSYGDNMTGEIKELKQGLLTFKTDAMSTVDIKWDYVIWMESDYRFVVEDSDGLKYYGSIVLSDSTGVLRVVGKDVIASVDKSRVVRITPVGRSFLANLDVSLSVGFSYTRASGVAQLTASSVMSYRTRANMEELSLSSIITSQDKDETSKRNDVTFSQRHFFKRRLFSFAEASLQQNDELGIDLRTLLTLGPGLNVIQTNRMLGLTTLGASLNSENSTDSTGVKREEVTYEGLISLSYSYFRYDTPKTNLSTKLAFYPSFSTQGRYRLDFELRYRHELFNDFFFEITFYDNFDSKAPSTGTNENDYSIVTGVSWSY